MREVNKNALLEHWALEAGSLFIVGESDGKRCFRVESDVGSLFVKARDAPDGVDDDIIYGLKIQSYLSDNGIPTSEILLNKRGLGFIESDGYRVTVERWVEPEELEPGPST